MSTVAALASRRIVPASSPLKRAMSSANKPNASGLSPEQSKALPERPAEESEQRIISAIKELYSCRPTETAYEVYSKEAVFQDPVGIAEGSDSIRAQFNALAKLFPRADIPKFKILRNPDSLSQDTILIDQDVAYYRDPSSSSPTKTLNSLLTIQTDGRQQIIKHIEEWNHKHDSTKEDGFFGMLNEQRKKLTASLTDTFTSKEPPKKA